MSGVALLTGAGSGMGQATAAMLVQRGRTVEACDIVPVRAPTV